MIQPASYYFNCVQTRLFKTNIVYTLDIYPNTTLAGIYFYKGMSSLLPVYRTTSDDSDMSTCGQPCIANTVGIRSNSTNCQMKLLVKVECV
ncbi:unnamed protein product [Adineta ricciae]|uniref:Uncharacterized protein n=1 Tax=Adineta ricciae TaxID=249248 RepID=A0A815YZA6_ADIRI|nr:unnamed protein product [Adineta ricciae]